MTTASSRMAATAPVGWSGLVAASATAPTASPVRAARAAANAVAAVQPPVARSSTLGGVRADLQLETGPAQRERFVRRDGEVGRAEMEVLGPA